MSHNIDWNNREQVLERVQQNGCALQYVSPALRADKEVVMAAVQQNGLALHYASEELKNDPVLQWFMKYRDRLTELLGKDKLNYANVEQLYQDRAFDVLKNLNKDLIPAIGSAPAQYEQTAILFAQIMLTQKLGAPGCKRTRFFS